MIKERLSKISLSLNDSFSIKTTTKKKEKWSENFSSVQKISKSWRNVHDLDLDPFFFSADPGSGSASKLYGSLALQKKA